VGPFGQTDMTKEESILAILRKSLQNMTLTGSRWTQAQTVIRDVLRLNGRKFIA